MSYHLQFQKLCAGLGLGRLAEPPSQLQGGHLHRVYSVLTDRGRYAVKALNPQVMQRPPALPGIIASERVAGIASRHIPAVPALVFNGSAVQELDGQYYLIYGWFDGRTLQNGEIGPAHRATMGRALAALHHIDFGALCCAGTQPLHAPAVDWRLYLQLGLNAGAGWTSLLGEHIRRLETWSAELAEAAKRLSTETVVSHRDLEPKNVLWCGGSPMIIDWEAAGRINPACDMVETAVYWSKDDAGQIGEEKFKTFLGAYQSIHGPSAADWPAVLAHGFSSLSGWLEYSLKRSLLIERCDEAEQQMGTEHVFGTLNAALLYFETVPRLLEWLT